MCREYKQKELIIGAILGATVATLTAALFNTKKGRQLQRSIGDAYDEVRDSIKETFSEGKDKIKQTAEQVKEAAGKEEPKKE